MRSSALFLLTVLVLRQHVTGLADATRISDVSDLFCYDFDKKCRWRNMEGLFIDELDWYQGTGFLDQGRLQVATGTHINGMYGIVATDQVQLATAKAILVSDVIGCQQGPGELRFLYWTSPDVHLIVCTKKVNKIFPDYDYCSGAIDSGDPGPAYITIPDQGNDAFQIYIRAENFVFHAVNLQGGFAIIDNIEYYGDLCLDQQLSVRRPENDILPLSPLSDKSASPSPAPPPAFPTLVDRVPIDINNRLITDNQEPTFSPANEIQEQLEIPPPPPPVPSAFAFQAPPARKQAVCDALKCNFDFGECLTWTIGTDWLVSSKPVGNPLTGIRGDASMLPYNREGRFAYVAGPRPYARLTTRSFTLDEPLTFTFSFHKVAKDAKFRVLAKREDLPSETELYEALGTTKDSRRWFREYRILQPGSYQYIAFEVRDLKSNNYVGVDELALLDASRQPFCS